MNSSNLHAFRLKTKNVFPCWKFLSERFCKHFQNEKRFFPFICKAFILSAFLCLATYVFFLHDCIRLPFRSTIIPILWITCQNNSGLNWILTLNGSYFNAMWPHKYGGSLWFIYYNSIPGDFQLSNFGSTLVWYLFFTRSVQMENLNLLSKEKPILLWTSQGSNLVVVTLHCFKCHSLLITWPEHRTDNWKCDALISIMWGKWSHVCWKY